MINGHVRAIRTWIMIIVAIVGIVGPVVWALISNHFAVASLERDVSRLEAEQEAQQRQIWRLYDPAGYRGGE